MGCMVDPGPTQGIESMKQAPRLTEFEGGRLPSADTKIQAQLRDGVKSVGVEQGRRKEWRRPVERSKGGPCGLLSRLEHSKSSRLTRQEKREKGDTARTSWSASLALKGPGASVFM